MHKESKIFITGGSGFIGTNLIDLLVSKGYQEIVNFDKVAPVKAEHLSYWEKGNIMNPALLSDKMLRFEPDIVIHLAARTDTLSDKLEDYDENITGSKNVLLAIKETPSIQRTLIISTQYVYKSQEQVFPLKEDDYLPHTVYGQSKVLTEKLTRDANLKCEWTIIRPTNIWGPWHMRYPGELWKVLDRGYYFHPVKHEVKRTYGYVKNIVFQMYNMMIAPKELVDGKMFYVGDAPIDSYKWLNEFAMQLNGKPIKRLPKIVFKTVALGGDLLRKCGIPFPLYSLRFSNMIEDYPAPTKLTIDNFGVAEASLSKNVSETKEWLEFEGKNYFEYWKRKV